MHRKPPPATALLCPIVGSLMVLGCAQGEEPAAQPSTDQLVARSVADVRAANAALAAPHAPSKSIAELARPATASQPARPAAAPPASSAGAADAG